MQIASYDPPKIVELQGATLETLNQELWRMGDTWVTTQRGLGLHCGCSTLNPPVKTLFGLGGNLDINPWV